MINQTCKNNELNVICFCLISSKWRKFNNNSSWCLIRNVWILIFSDLSAVIQAGLDLAASLSIFKAVVEFSSLFTIPLPSVPDPRSCIGCLSAQGPVHDLCMIFYLIGSKRRRGAINQWVCYGGYLPSNQPIWACLNAREKMRVILYSNKPPGDKWKSTAHGIFSILEILNIEITRYLVRWLLLIDFIIVIYCIFQKNHILQHHMTFQIYWE